MGKTVGKLLWMSLAVTSLLAQDFVGSWQGAMVNPQGQELKVVIKISRGEDAGLKAVLHRVDQPSQPINASAVTAQGSNLRMAIANLGANYDGKLSADGNAITGTFTQAAPLVLNLVRETPATAWTIPPPPAPPKPMAADADPGFEVATIKPANPDRTGTSLTIGQGGMFNATNQTLKNLIGVAYSVHAQQISGAPSWTETEKFDITAKPDTEGAPNVTQVQTMLKKLLADRFGLTFHREKKEISAYTLNIGRDGPKMTKSEAGGTLPGFGGRGPGSIVVRNTTMGEFAEFLQARVVDRPVVDQTGLTGRYEFTLSWRPEQLAAAPANTPLPPDVESRSDIFTAFQEQIGLKFEATKAPVDVLVIDRVEKPSEN